MAIRLNYSYKDFFNDECGCSDELFEAFSPLLREKGKSTKGTTPPKSATSKTKKPTAKPKPKAKPAPSPAPPANDHKSKIKADAEAKNVVHYARGFYGPEGGHEPTYYSMPSRDELQPFTKNNKRTMLNMWTRGGATDSDEEETPPPPRSQRSQPTSRMLPKVEPGSRVNEFEKALAAFLAGASQAMKKGATPQQIRKAKEMGQKLIDDYLLRKARHQNERIGASEEYSGLYPGGTAIKNAPGSEKKFGAFKAAVKGLGLYLPDSKELKDKIEAMGGKVRPKGANSDYGPSAEAAAMRGIDATSTAKVKTEFIEDESGNRIGYRIGEQEEFLNTELPVWMSEQDIVTAFQNPDLVQRLEETTTYQRLLEETKATYKVSDETARAIAHNLLNEEIIENYRKSIIMNRLLDENGKLNGRVLKSAERITVLNNVRTLFKQDDLIPESVRRKLCGEEEGSGLINKMIHSENFDEYNRYVKEMFTLLEKDAPEWPDAAAFSETICMIGATFDSDVVIPNNKSFRVADFVRFRHDDAGVLVDVQFSSVKWKAGGAGGAEGYIGLTNYESFYDRHGRLVTGLEIQATLLGLAGEVADMWDQAYNNSVCSKNKDGETTCITSAYTTTVDAVAELLPVILANEYGIEGYTRQQYRLYVDRAVSCWQNNQEPNFDLRAENKCTTSDKEMAEKSTDPRCRHAWKTYFLKGRLIEKMKNHGSLTDGYMTNRVVPSSGIEILDDRRQSKTVRGRRQKRQSWQKFQAGQQRMLSKYKGCTKPKSGIVLRTTHAGEGGIE